MVGTHGKDSIRELIGKTGDPLRFSVESGAIRRYADAIGERNPLHTDETFPGLPEGVLLAPPGFFGWPVRLSGNMPFYPKLRVELLERLAEHGFNNLLDGSLDYEFFTPIKAGDVLDVTMTIKDLAQKHGRSGEMIICTLEFSYCRPDGEEAARVAQRIIAK